MSESLSRRAKEVLGDLMSIAKSDLAKDDHSLVDEFDTQRG